MKKKLLLCAFLSVGLGLFAETINLEQARTLALANSKTLEKYSLAIRSSILDERNQLYSMLPSISAEYSANMSYLNRNWGFENPIDTFSAGATFSITQIIFQGGKSFIQKAISSIATESIRNEALAEYFNILDAVDNAYYSVLEAAASLKAEETSLETAVLSLSMAEIRHTNGIINQGDYLRALADKEARENSRNQARRNITLSVSRLKVLAGIQGTVEFAEIELDEFEQVIERLAGITDEETDVLYDELRKKLAANPALARAGLNSQRAEKNLTLTRRDYSPTLSATIFSTGLNYSQVNGFSNNTAGGIQIRGKIPLDFWITANRIERSRLAVDSAALDYSNTEVNLETELLSALLNTLVQAGSVLSSRRTLEYTEKHFEYVMERYRLLQSSVSDLSEASSLLITSRNNLIRSSYGFLQSLSRLRSLGAIEDEEQLIEILLGNISLNTP